MFRAGAIRKQDGHRVAALQLCRFAAFCVPEPLEQLRDYGENDIRITLLIHAMFFLA